MPSHKSHHFIPQFFLRFFSSDGASIGLHNLKSGKTVTGASLKHQACKDWFYGRDGRAEHALAEFEGGSSRVLRAIVQTGRPPKRYSDDHRVFATYVNIQTARTTQAAAEHNEMVDKLGKGMLRRRLKDPELLEFLDHVEIELTDPMATAIRPALLDTPVILDLKFKLLHNLTGVPFVLGDHPAVKHNDLFRDAAVSVLGLANLGLQIILPLSPQYVIVFYDEGAYRLGQPFDNVVRVTSEADVLALNDFQWANALENVYFRPDGANDRWILARERIAQLRRSDHVLVDEHQITGPRRGVLMTVQTQRPSRALAMPLFRCLMAPPPIVGLRTILPLRDPDWAFHVHGLRDAFEAGEVSSEDFHLLTTPEPFLKRSISERAKRR